jgi:phenylacetate-coenzyme A ligase PaaK-like adenylate-forming protein
MHIELPNITREWTDKVFRLVPAEFEEMALQIFLYQYHNNKIYGQYANAVGKPPENVQSLTDIPFLPISFFKTHKVTSTEFEAEVIFESSGTTQTINSRHYVKDLQLYRQSFTKAFEQFYGNIADYCMIGLLPSYLERQHSSLVVMADELIRQSNHANSGFYLYDHEKLLAVLQSAEQQQQKTLFMGVTFALLDFAEKLSLRLRHTIVMETGGMKGRREEWTRQQVHHFLQQQFGVDTIHSEYGMTELLSQAYSKADGIFKCPAWMKVMLRADDNPLHLISHGNGVINVIDLANIYSCAFIATDDVGKIYPDGSFEVLGRLDTSDLRGCSLMAL